MGYHSWIIHQPSNPGQKPLGTLMTPLCKPARRHPGRWLPVAALVLLLAGCVFRVDVQQGNLLDEVTIDAVQVGMTRSQVRFLLGTPVVQDVFHTDRWDYAYYLRRGRSRYPQQRWVIVWFDGDVVRAIERDVPTGGNG